MKIFLVRLHTVSKLFKNFYYDDKDLMIQWARLVNIVSYNKYIG